MKAGIAESELARPQRPVRPIGAQVQRFISTLTYSRQGTEGELFFRLWVPARHCEACPPAERISVGAVTHQRNTFFFSRKYRNHYISLRKTFCQMQTKIEERNLTHDVPAHQ